MIELMILLNGFVLCITAAKPHRLNVVQQNETCRLHVLKQNGSYQERSFVCCSISLKLFVFIPM